MKYEEFVKTTDISLKHNVKGHDLQFYLDGMSEEHGELFGVTKRIRRGDYGENVKEFISNGGSLKIAILCYKDIFEDVLKEIGDHHWYETRFIQELGLNWDRVEDRNMNKLTERVNTDTIMGKGDNREHV